MQNEKAADGYEQLEIFNEAEIEQTHLIRHYDALIDEGNDPFFDPPELREYMDKWDGKKFIDAMKLDKEKSVLEIGVGTGRLAVRTAPLCGKFCGIDLSPKTVERVTENLDGLPNVRIFCGDFLTYSFCETFDVIYSSLTFMHIKNKQAALNKTAVLLNDGGRLVLSVDKNQSDTIDLGSCKVKIYPDKPKDIENGICTAGLKLIKRWETEFAVLYAASKGF